MAHFLERWGFLGSDEALLDELNAHAVWSTSVVVDSGAITLCIPEHVALQLQLTELEKREVSTADGKSLLVSYVGPVQIHFENRNCFTGALVMGETVLLGAVPLEDMDLVINPRLQQVTVNPASPNIPTAVVKKAVARNI